MKIDLSKEEFQRLYNAILDKCAVEEGFQPLGKGEALFGFGRILNDKKHSGVLHIKKIMESKEKVKSVMEAYNKKMINGKYLYDRYRELQSDKIDKISLTLFYKDVYLKFIGYNDIATFLTQSRRDNPLTGREKEDSQKLEKLADSNFLYYRCYYYSYRKNTVKNFNFKINKTNNTFTLTGLHDSQISSDVADGTVYSGEKIEFLERNARFELKSEENPKEKISLLVYRGTRPLDKQIFLRGIYLTVSSFGFPISGEMIMAKIDNPESKLSTDTETLIKRYLNLERRNFFTPDASLLQNEHLRAKDKTLSVLEPLVGQYFVWSFSYFTNDESKKDQIRVYKSKFEIYSDYKAELYSAYGLGGNIGDRLDCWLWVADELKSDDLNQISANRKASVTAFKGDDFIIKSHSMMDIPNPSSELATAEVPGDESIKYNPNDYIKGVYCSFGSRNRDFLASALIFERISDVTVYKDSKPRSFSYQEVSESEAYKILRDHYVKTTVQWKSE